MPSTDRPRLVPLEARRLELPDGRAGVALSDPLGVLGELEPQSAAGWYLLAHFDGTRTVADVEAALAGQGLSPGRARIEERVARARARGLLDGPAYQARRRAALDAFHAGPRPAACAGSSYPADPGELRALLDGILGLAPQAETAPGLRLLVAPHVDYARGAACYARAYGALRGAAADLFVVFGTAHLSPERLFTLTRQDYDTPLGTVPTDRALVDELAGAVSEEELFGDELCHRTEHSVEFQLVWLRHLFPDRFIRALPVLCSGIAHLSDPGAATGRFLAALGRALAGRRVCILAGADLAHVGPMYGDVAAPTPAQLAGLREEDRRTLAFLERGDAAGFHRDGARDDARRRVCGIAPVYAALRTAGRGARLLHYAQWTDGTDSVSFAAAAG